MKSNIPNKNNSLPYNEIIDKHLDDFFEEEDISVIYEKESDSDIQSDIYVIKPNEERDFYILLTCGMSSKPMTVPDNLEELQYAELMMILPSTWKVTPQDFKNEDNFWPVRLLRQLSKLPHQNQTWLGYSHVLEIDTTIKANHKFEGVALVDSITFAEEFTIMNDRNKNVYIYSVMPLYKDELDFGVHEGIEPLLELFQEFEISEVLDINRPNVGE